MRNVFQSFPREGKGKEGKGSAGHIPTIARLSSKITLGNVPVTELLPEMLDDTVIRNGCCDGKEVLDYKV